jgi:hypothetical protein
VRLTRIFLTATLCSTSFCFTDAFAAGTDVASVDANPVAAAAAPEPVVLPLPESVATDIVVENNAATYHALTAQQRLEWFGRATVGAQTMSAGLASSGFSTLMNEPSEYGGAWSGFGQRYGMRLTGIATSNAMEVGLGAIWGEDPRYHRAGPEMSFQARLGHVVKYTFMTYDGDGKVRPAYARFIAYSGSNFISNTWRAQSEANTSSALDRTVLAFTGEMGSNTFEEFWPDFKRKFMPKRHHQTTDLD